VSKGYLVGKFIKMGLGTIWRGFFDPEKEEA